MAEFKRLGVEDDLGHYYSTMDYKAEATIAAELMKFAMNGALFRGSKPVMWSVVEKTALAEAEVEYQDYTSDTVWVKFPVRGLNATAGPTGDVGKLLHESSVLIWTTTPWTLPGNRAISWSSKIKYGVYKVTKSGPDNWAKEGDRYIIAEKLVGQVMKAARVEAWELQATLSRNS